MEVGIPGRYVVYLPSGKGAGVSRRLGREERERLRAVSGEVKPEVGGLIIRTAAEGEGKEAIERDLRFLQRMWAGAERRARAACAPALVYAEVELAVRSVRDLLGPDFTAVVVDDQRLHRRLVSYLHAVAPELERRVTRHDGEAMLFESLGLEKEIEKALSRRVELPSGGYLIIDHTEAMTVIDVNTGRYVGRRHLEDTTVKTNLEACREIVRQLRLRDVGGIIVIDFIDMTAKTNRDAVLAALEAEFTLDRTKTYVVEISPLGLVEMTRQNATQGLREIITAPCPACRGQGRVISEESALIGVERRLGGLLRASTLPVLRVEVHPRLAARISTGGAPMLQRLEAQTGRRFIIEEAGAEVALDHVAVVPD
jgi:ribonuclease G